MVGKSSNGENGFSTVDGRIEEEVPSLVHGADDDQSTSVTDDEHHSSIIAESLVNIGNLVGSSVVIVENGRPFDREFVRRRVDQRAVERNTCAHDESRTGTAENYRTTSTKFAH